MLIVGEKINTTRKEVARAVEEKDAVFLQELAKKQVEAGADLVDVNVGTRISSEPEDLEWVIEIVQEVVEVPLCIDSPNPLALERGLRVCQRRPLINSLSGEKERMEKTLPLLKKYNPQLVVLSMDEGGIPPNSQGRVRVVEKILQRLKKEGIKEEDIFIDPLLRPVSTEPRGGKIVLDTLSLLKETFPGVKTIVGLSNISFGLPRRRLLNRSFLLLCLSRGLDAVILDPLDKEIRASLFAAEVLLGEDEFCGRYLKAYREGILEGNIKKRCQPRMKEKKRG